MPDFLYFFLCPVEKYAIMCVIKYFEANRKEISMDIRSLTHRLTAKSGSFLFAVLALQPLLDVLSYFMNEYGSTLITTNLRAILLFAVFAFGLITERDNRRVYYIFLGVISGFWLLHALNCLRVGYIDPLWDIGEYLRLIQFPLWTLAFITLFRNRQGLEQQAAGLLALNLLTVLLVIFLSYAAGMPAYTYDIPSRGVKIGVLGWFAIPNSQSAIVSILVLGALLWAYNTGRIWLFCGVCAAGFSLLYFTGTRLAYYSAIIMALGFAALALISGGRGRLCCIPLALVIVLFIGFKGMSVMEYRQSLTQDSFDIYQKPTDEIMGEYKDYEYGGGEIPPEILERITGVYEDIYGGQSFAGTPLLGDLLDRFGTKRVMESYKYTTDASVLYNVRVKKLKVTSLLWEEQDLLTRLIGVESSAVRLNGTNYDPENDFPALLFYYGYLGAGLYVCFAGYFILAVVWRCLKNIRRLPEVLTVPLGTWAMMIVLGLGAAQFSGQVLRKPSVTVYISLAAAELYMLMHDSPRLRARYERRQGLTIKQRPVK